MSQCLYSVFTPNLSSRWVLASLILTQLCLLTIGALVHSPSIDEPVHLFAGLHMLREGRTDFNLGNPPLVDIIAAAPIVAFFPHFDLLADRYLSLDSVPQDSAQIMTVFFLSRLMLIPITLLGGCCVYFWSKSLYGPGAAALTLSLWTFQPCILAFGQQVTGDMAAASFGVFASYSFSQWMRKAAYDNAVIAGTTMGLALLSKMVWVMLFGLWPLLWVAVVFLQKDRSLRLVLRQASQLTVILATAVLVLNAGYGFDNSLFSLDKHPQIMQMWLGNSIPKVFQYLPIPLPYNYVRGIVDVQNVLSNPEESYLAGTWKIGGWWSYYLYGMTVKIPTGTLVLVVVASSMSIMDKDWQRDWAVIFPALAFFLFVSFTTSNMSTQYRYILPAYPYLLILAGKPVRLIIGNENRNRSAKLGIRTILKVLFVATMTFWSVVSSILAFPHSYAYFNELAGGPTSGHRHFLGSSLDWGQDLVFLKHWKAAQCPTRPIWLAYRTSLHPNWLNIDFRPPPAGLDATQASEVTANSIGPQEGWYVISESLLHGKIIDTWSSHGGMIRLRPQDVLYLRDSEPIDRIGYSMLVYYLSFADVENLRTKHRLRTEKLP